MKVAPKIVSCRVVNTWIASFPSAIGKEASQPKLFPIQFLCIVRTRSGQPGRRSQYSEELVDVCGDPEEPLVQVLLPDLRAATPAEARLHLLVGEDRPALGAPVHRGALLVGEPFSYIRRKKSCSHL